MALLRIRITLVRIGILFFTFKRIRILPFTLKRIRILLFNLMRIRTRILPLTFFPDLDPPILQNDPLRLAPFHFAVDPDPAFHFGADADPDPAFYFNADPDSDPASQNDVFHADPDPQHCNIGKIPNMF